MNKLNDDVMLNSITLKQLAASLEKMKLQLDVALIEYGILNKKCNEIEQKINTKIQSLDNNK